LRIKSPEKDSVFRITADAGWPAIPVSCDAELAPGQQLTWDWRIQWNQHEKSGRVVAATKTWNAKGAVEGLGGALTVTVTGPGGTAATSVEVSGINPAAGEVLAFLASQPGSAGFEKILEHETHMTHFDSMGQPRASFDSGFGICQLTHPAPSYEECWSWKLNIEAGLALYAAKRQAAARYLSQMGRSFAPEQLTREAVARWNGGSYHVWSAAQGAWVRNPAVLCDSQTGNIGWDMTKAGNKDQSEAILHQRDKGKYRHPPGPGDGWGYFGVCYADRLLA
jgi:hypothetical protein